MSGSSAPGITPLDITLRTKIVFGPGRADDVGRLAKETGGSRALIVTDAGVRAAGHVARVESALHAASVATAIFAATRENPTTADVDACLAVAQREHVDCFIGLGGGSSIDTARATNLVMTNGGCIADYRGHGHATKPLLPFIAIPTTAGTGSECQSYAVIADAETHAKMACGDPKAAARVAILDPLLTLTMPRHVTAATGLDALVHAVETSVTTARNTWSLLFAHDAFRLVHSNLPRVLESPDEVAARSAMQLGAAFAGIAIEASMLGAAHACANPLTARFGIVHGQAVAVMLPHVMRWNAEQVDVGEAYRDLAVRSGLVPSSTDAESALQALLQRIDHLLVAAQMPRSLAACGIPRHALSDLACEAATQWTARFNPRAVDEASLLAIYQAAWEGAE